MSARQLTGLGIARTTVADWAAAGRLHRLHRGVYAVGHRRLTWHGHCLAAVLASSPALASHFSAAWLWGLLRSSPATFDVTAATRRHHKPDVRLHFAQLAEADRATVDAIPLTALSRTVLDLAAVLPAARLGRMLERSEELKLFDLFAFESLLDRTVGHSGHGRLARALDIYRDSDPAYTRSGVERLFLRLVREAELPPPAMNYVVAGFELDAYWKAERFAVELDIYETHGTRASFESDRIRDDDLLLLGIEMIRVTGPRLRRQPRATIQRVAAHLARRRRELSLN